MAKQLSAASGLSRILVAQNAIFKGFLPEAITPLILETQKQFNFTHILSGATAFGKVEMLSSAHYFTVRFLESVSQNSSQVRCSCYFRCD